MLLAEINESLKTIARAHKPPAPNWKRPLKDYGLAFFQAKGIKIIEQDEHGPTLVSFDDELYTRRVPSNQKYGMAVWFSRAVGKDEDGENQYETLVRFKDFTPAEPMDNKTAKAVENARGG